LDGAHYGYASNTVNTPGQRLAIQAGRLFPWAALNTADSTLKCFPLGKIPNFEIPSGTFFKFYYYSRRANAGYSFKTLRPVANVVFALPNIRYRDTLTAAMQINIPDTLNTPFQVMVYGYAAGSVLPADSQSFLITPAVTINREDLANGVPSGQRFPDKADLKYMIVSDDSTGMPRQYFNGRLVSPRIVEVAGIDLTIGTGGPRDASDIYYRYNSDGVINTNIGELHIYADNLTINSKFWLPGTDVYIYARTITFKGTGSLVTNALGTPIQGNVRDEGIPGSDGGDIHIYAKEMYADGVRFFLNGGNGMDGVPRSSGIDPIIPGLGGSGGVLTSNVDLRGLFEAVNGSSGRTNGGKDNNKTSGTVGYTVYENRPNAWIHPHAFRMVKKYIDQLYLYGFYDSTAAMAERYATYLLEAGLSVGGNTPDLDQAAETDIGPLAQGFMATLQQLGAGLDYNGNPRGWVPMMSYRASQATFLAAINPVIEAIYLSQLVKSAYQTNSAKVTAMTKAANNFNSEMTQDTASVSQLLTDLPTLDAKVAANRASRDSLSAAKDKYEAELKEKIKKSMDDQLRAAQKKARWGGVLKLAGAITSCIPFPGSGVVATALTTAGNYVVSSGSDDGEDYSVGGDGSVGDDYEKNDGPGTKYEALSEVQAEASEGPCDATNVSNFNKEDCRNNKNTNLTNKSVRVAEAGLNLIADFKKKSVPQHAIDQAFDKAKATDPALKAIAEQASALSKENLQLSNTIKAEQLRVTKLNQQISNALSAISYLSFGRSQTLGRIDMRMMQYMDDMEKQAIERLQTYQYWMAKSFEYTNCAPFRGDLDISSLLSRIRTMLDTSGNGTLPLNQLQALRTIFTSQVEDNKALILNAFNQSGAPIRESITYELNADQIAALQKGEIGDENAILFNLLQDSDLLSNNQEDLRIIDIAVDSMTIVPKDPNHRFHPNVRFELNVDYPKYGFIRSKGQKYQFFFGDYNQDYTISWGANYYPRRLQINRKSWDVGDICSVITGAPFVDCNTGTLLTRPALDADLQIRLARQGIESDTMPHEIKRLSLRINYTYRNSSNSDMQLVIKANDARLMPPFEVSRRDRFTRRSGYGYLYRTYTRNSGPVEVKTQSRYGHYKFVRWRLNGQSQPSGQTTLSINTNTLRTARAVAEFRPTVVRSQIIDTMYVPHILNGRPFYLPIASTGLDTLETITDSIETSVSGFAFAQTPRHKLIAPSRVDSVALLAPDYLQAGVRALGAVYTYNPDDSVFVHKTVFLQADLTVGINKPAVSQLARIIPNPAVGNVTVQLPDTYQIQRLTVQDAAGRVIDMTYTLTDASTAYVETRDLSPGLYFIKVQTTSGLVSTSRLVKQ
jgi:hypothetical protein